MGVRGPSWRSGGGGGSRGTCCRFRTGHRWSYLLVRASSRGGGVEVYSRFGALSRVGGSRSAV